LPHKIKEYWPCEREILALTKLYVQVPGQLERQEKINRLSALFRTKFNAGPEAITGLPFSGSQREYFRLKTARESAIGVYNEDTRENRAFMTFTHYFWNLQLNVPEVYTVDLDKHVYLLQDLGDLTLHDFVLEQEDPWDEASVVPGIYRNVLEQLTGFQLAGTGDFDYSVCVPRPAFDMQSVLWDLYYFKYYCLKLFGVSFDEQLLEDDFQTLAAYLESVSGGYFLYRDFQSRNIMLVGDKQYFIDYQGGRKGPLQYDLATLLFQSRVNMPPGMREEMLGYYLEAMGSRLPVKKEQFISEYYHFVLARILQALAAYGLRGMVENKGTFLASLPYGISNLQWLLDNVRLTVKVPELTRALEGLVSSTKVSVPVPSDNRQFVVSVNSFSYKKGIPKDMSGHGGGFVFDCRALPNPGRIEEFKSLTGLDEPVKKFLSGKKEVTAYLTHIRKIIVQTVNEYRQRRFTRLMISFGCTGGQHRSVYCAERTREYLERHFDVAVEINHRELS
jgi:aminoglycoside/choline kinase family phosphotransferase